MRNTNDLSSLTIIAIVRNCFADLRRGLTLAIGAIFSVVLLEASTAQAVPVAPGAPVSGYLFDEGSGTSTADTFGSNNGTLVAMEPGDWVTTTPFSYAGNGSLNFDGGTEGSAGQRDRVSLGQPSNLNFDPNADSFTISAWLQVDTQGTIVSKAQNTTGGRQYQAFVIAGQIPGANVGGLEGSGGGPLSTGNNWHHYALISTPGSASVYINGNTTPVATFNPGTATNPLLDVYIGARHGSDTDFDATTGFELDGRVDELAFWSSALTTDNVEWLATNSLQGLISVPQVPEPSTLMLLAFGIMGLVSRARRRRQQA